MSVMSSVEASFCRSAPWRGFARQVVLPWALRDVSIGQQVLEIGGGSGAMAQELLRREPSVHLTMADMDPAMVAAAGRRLGEFGPRAAAVEADATDLSFADDSFDTVCTWLMLHHTIRWSDVLSEARRVLHPGGNLVGYDLSDSSAARLVHRIDRSEHQLIRAEEIEAQFSQQDFTEVQVSSALGGLVMKFQARKSTAFSSAPD